MYLQKNMRKKHGIVAVTLLLLLLLFIFLVMPVLLSPQQNGSLNTSVNQKPNSSVNEKCVLVDRKEKPEGFQQLEKFHYTLNQEVAFSKWNSLGNVMIENPSYNYYSLFVEWKDDKGEIVYVSPVIPPGYQVEKDELHSPLDKGSHTVSVAIYALDPTTSNQVALAEETIQVHIKKR